MQDNSTSVSDSVAEAVLASLRASVGPNKGPVERSHSLADDLAIDSLEFAALVQEIEDKTGTMLDEKELAKAVTVGDLIDLVERTRAAKGAPKAT